MNLTIAPLGKHLVILRSMDNVLKNYFSGKVGLISITVFLLDERSNTLDIFTRGLILKFHFVGNMTYLSWSKEIVRNSNFAFTLFRGSLHPILAANMELVKLIFNSLGLKNKPACHPLLFKACVCKSKISGSFILHWKRKIFLLHLHQHPFSFGLYQIMLPTPELQSK